MAGIARWALRLGLTGLLWATAAIHLYLWANGYRGIPTIGWLFLLCGISGGVLGIAVLAAPKRLMALTALASGGFEIGTVIGLWISTVHGLFGFIESSRATDYWLSVGVEIAGALVAAALAVAARSEVGRRRAALVVSQPRHAVSGR